MKWLHPNCVEQRRHNPYVGEGFSELDHAKQAAAAEPLAIFSRQLRRQRRHNLLAVPRPLMVQRILPDPFADVPAKADQCGVDRPRRLFAGSLDERADVAQQPVGGNRRHDRCRRAGQSAPGELSGLGHRWQSFLQGDDGSSGSSSSERAAESQYTGTPPDRSPRPCHGFDNSLIGGSTHQSKANPLDLTGILLFNRPRVLSEFFSSPRDRKVFLQNC